MSANENPVMTNYTNVPDGMGGDVQIERETICVQYHLGTCDHEKGKQRKMRSDSDKIRLRRAQSPHTKAQVDIIETKVAEE